MSQFTILNFRPKVNTFWDKATFILYMQGGMYDTIKIGFDILLRTSSPWL